MVTFGSKEQKEKLLALGYRQFFQKFTVVEYKEDPEVTQCFRCQAFGHNHRDCKAEKQKCLRCGGDHRHRNCPHDRNHVCCANCGQGHVSTYKGCAAYKQAVQEEKVRRENLVSCSHSTSDASVPGNHAQQQQLPHRQQQQHQHFLHQDQQQHQHQQGLSDFATQNSEALISAFTLCIHMVVDSVKEMMSSGKPILEADCRVIAETCVEALSFLKPTSRPSVWEMAAARRQNGITSTANLGASSSCQGQSHQDG